MYLKNTFDWHHTRHPPDKKRSKEQKQKEIKWKKLYFYTYLLQINNYKQF